MIFPKAILAVIPDSSCEQALAICMGRLISVPDTGLLFWFLNLSCERTTFVSVASMYASHAVGRGFAPRLGHTKEYHKDMETLSSKSRNLA